MSNPTAIRPDKTKPDEFGPLIYRFQSAIRRLKRVERLPLAEGFKAAYRSLRPRRHDG